MLKRLLFGGDGAASPTGDIGLMLLRGFTGLFIALGHGWSKLPPPDGFVGLVQKLGFPAPGAFAWMAGISEFAGGLLLALGLLTRPAALCVVGTMAVAALGQHWSDPLFVPRTGGPAKEMALLYLMPALLFLFTGAGRYGFDAPLRDRGRRRRAD